MDKQVKECLEKIMKQPSKGLMAYAQSYADAALKSNMSGNTLRVQLLYVLNNLSGWRGTEAKATKCILRSALKRRKI